MTIYLGLLDGTPYNRKRYKTVEGAVRARREINDHTTVKLRIFRKADDCVERYEGYNRGRPEWSTVE